MNDRCPSLRTAGVSSHWRREGRDGCISVRRTCQAASRPAVRGWRGGGPRGCLCVPMPPQGHCPDRPTSVLVGLSMELKSPAGRDPCPAARLLRTGTCSGSCSVLGASDPQGPGTGHTSQRLLHTRLTVKASAHVGTATDSHLSCLGVANGLPGRHERPPAEHLRFLPTSFAPFHF